MRFPLCYRSACFVLILLKIFLTANVYVCECVHMRVLNSTEGKRRSSDVTLVSVRQNATQKWYGPEDRITTISKFKNVVYNYVIHKNIIFQSTFSNKFK